MFFPRFSVVVVVAGFAVACGSSSNNGGAGGADGGVEGGTGPGGTTPGSNPSSSKPGGTITIMQSTDSDNGSLKYKGRITAHFSSVPPSQTPGCTVKTEGSCEIMVCPKDDAGTAANANPISAGTITITGLGQQPVKMEPQQDKTYSDAEAESTGGPVIAPGANIQVSTSGADIPAFNTSMVAGNAIDVVKPTFGQFLDTHPGTGDLVVIWKGSTDAVYVAVSAESGSDKLTNIACTFNGKTGQSGTIPASVMQTLNSTGSIMIGTLSPVSLTAGNYAIDLRTVIVAKAGIFAK